MFQYTFIYQLYFFHFLCLGDVLKTPSIIGNTSLLSYEKIDSVVGVENTFIPIGI